MCRKINCLQRLEARTGSQCGGSVDGCIAQLRESLGLDPAYEVCGVSGGTD